ncbi:MAG: branched-chain amino acid ABC transporter permease [Acidimicrobiia bacterium]|nr:branched-chain amino acid ABC transporter permease [Acidimicrobiia bacterium]MDH3470018.1 branched-chain amino acid ABC transporter permease [Acidimicrobiia bacterium]
MINFLQVLILGLLLGGVYALMASGLTLLFGVMRIVNLAHGVFIIFAAYLAFFASDKLGVDPLISIAFTMPMMFFLGIIIYVLFFPRIETSARYVEMTVLMTFGIALVVEGLLGYFFTGIFRSSRPGYATDSIIIGDIFIPMGQLLALTVSVVLLVGLWLFLRYTRIGTAVRATMQNRTAAQIVGVNVRRISAISFGIGMALAGASGSLMSYLFPFFPARHWQWVALLLALIVLGGFGSLKGAVIGALSLAVAAAFVTDQFGPDWSPMTFYLALFVILMVRPQGLFGKALRI